MSWREMIKRERRRKRDRTEYIRLSKIFSIFYFHLTFTILNAQSDLTAVSEDVSDTIQFFMRRKFLIVSSIELVTLFFDQLLQQKDCIYLTSNTSLVCQFVDIVLFRILRMKLS